MTTDGELQGLTVFDSDGSKIGSVGQVYLDDRTGQPEWVTVKTGLFGSKESFVPLEAARRQDDGLHIPYSKETVKDAPRMESGEHLDQPDEARLYSHYQISGSGSRDMASDTSSNRGGKEQTAGMAGTSGTAGTAGMAGMAGGAMAGGRDTTDRDMTGRDTAGMRSGMDRGTDDTTDLGRRNTGAAAGIEDDGESMIRSEEQLRVSTEEQETGRARLRKYVVTEHVTTTVPVTHEEVEVVREPISENDRTSYNRPIGDGEVEVTLHGEQAMVRKESVPVERVRLHTEKVTEQQEVSADVQKEQVDYENDTDAERGGKHGRGRNS